MPYKRRLGKHLLNEQSTRITELEGLTEAHSLLQQELQEKSQSVRELEEQLAIVITERDSVFLEQDAQATTLEELQSEQSQLQHELAQRNELIVNLEGQLQSAQDQQTELLQTIAARENELQQERDSRETHLADAHGSAEQQRMPSNRLGWLPVSELAQQLRRWRAPAALPRQIAGASGIRPFNA